MTKPQIVFIVSQPRAGSTLLQTMLGGHDSICEVGETWMMLRMIDVLSGARRGTVNPYDGELAEEAISMFAKDHLDRGMATIRAELASAVRRIYASVNRGNSSVLIDKTPRYYWIVEDLLNLLPEAKVIVLHRNPMSVLVSIINTWGRRRKAGFLNDWKADLLEAPIRLAAASELSDPRIMTVHYEKLVEQTENELDRLQRFIGVDIQSGLSSYTASNPREYGDPNGVYRASQAHAASLHKWVDHFATCPADWRLTDDYLNSLGETLVQRLGYDFSEIKNRLNQCRPAAAGFAPSLDLQISPRPDEPLNSVVKLRRTLVDALPKQKVAA